MGEGRVRWKGGEGSRDGRIEGWKRDGRGEGEMEEGRGEGRGIKGGLEQYKL